MYHPRGDSSGSRLKSASFSARPATQCLNFRQFDLSVLSCFARPMKPTLKPTWIALGTLFVSLSTFASEAWQNLGADDAVYLSQKIVLPALRSGKIIIPTGETYALESITPLDGISVVDYIFMPKRCKIPEKESEMELILPIENSATSKAEVGVIFLKGCRLEILVETKDLGKPSFFRR